MIRGFAIHYQRPSTVLRLAEVLEFRIIAHERMQIVASSQDAKHAPTLRWVPHGTSTHRKATANRHANGLRTLAHIADQIIGSKLRSSTIVGSLSKPLRGMTQDCTSRILQDRASQLRTAADVSCEAIIANARLRTLRPLMPMAMGHVTEGRTAGTKEIGRTTVRSRRATARAVSSFVSFLLYHPVTHTSS